MAAMHLNSLELGLLAQFNLETAGAYNEVAEHHRCRLGTRETARESSFWSAGTGTDAGIRARRLGSYPNSVPDQLAPEHSAPCGALSDRSKRRIRERRGSRSLPPAALGSWSDGMANGANESEGRTRA
jgi:hypothetical protein